MMDLTVSLKWGPRLTRITRIIFLEVRTAETVIFINPNKKGQQVRDNLERIFYIFAQKCKL